MKEESNKLQSRKEKISELRINTSCNITAVNSFTSSNSFLEKGISRTRSLDSLDCRKNVFYKSYLSPFHLSKYRKVRRESKKTSSTLNGVLKEENIHHLIVLQHGLHGSSEDYQYFRKILGDNFNENGIFIHSAKCNSSSRFSTHDGIDHGGVRLADEIENISSQYANLKYISIVGHSLGGLYARYCIGVLHSRGYFRKIKPMNFITLSTPNLGIRRPNRGYFNKLYNIVSPYLFSRTGAQFTLTDRATNKTINLANSGSKTIDSSIKFIYILSEVIEKATCSGWIEIQRICLNSRKFSSFPAYDPANYINYYGLIRMETCELLLFSTTRGSEKSVERFCLFGKSCRIEIIRGEILIWDIVFEETEDFEIRIRIREEQSLWEKFFEWSIGFIDAGVHFHRIIDNCTEDTICKSISKSHIHSKSCSQVPLLLCLTQGHFLQGLKQFCVRSLYSNLFYDLQVPYSSSSIRSHNPFRGDPTGCPTSPIYPHLTLHSLPNAKLYRDSQSRVILSPSNRRRKSIGSPKAILVSMRTPRRRSSSGPRLNQASVSRKSSPFIFKQSNRQIKLNKNLGNVSNIETDYEEFIKEIQEDGMKIIDPIWEAFGSQQNVQVREWIRAMLLNLQCLSWRRMDVVFDGILAHERIIGKKSEWFTTKESGQDIAHHIVDTFVLS